MNKTIYNNLRGGGLVVRTLTRIPRKPKEVRDGGLWKFICRHLMKRHYLASIDLSLFTALVNGIEWHRDMTPEKSVIVNGKKQPIAAWDKEHWRLTKRLGRDFMINDIEKLLNTQHQPSNATKAPATRNQKLRKTGLRISRTRKTLKTLKMRHA